MFTAILLILVIAAVVLSLSRHKAPAPGGGSRPGSAGSSRIAAETAYRSQAVAWVADQVDRNDIVACDAVMCAALAAGGFPAGNLMVLSPTSPVPFGSDVLVATADIRSHFGSQLSTADAPEVIAAFGTGTARIDIRAVAQDGTAAFRIQFRADQAARRSSGAELLRNKGIAVSALARRQLAAGQVDPRLMSTIVFLAAQQPVDIVGFGSSAPGAGPGVPLRFADLAETDARARLTGPAYLQSMLALLSSQQLVYAPMSTATVRLPGGQDVIRIQFAAPTPLGLLRLP